MISEEAGNDEGIKNNLAVEYVHDIAARARDNTFDVSGEKVVLVSLCTLC